MCHFPPRLKTDLAEAKIVKIGNPSVEYSLDMAPSDFYLSEKFKRHKFCFSVSVEHNLKTFFQQKTKCFYQNGANKLGERWKSCFCEDVRHKSLQWSNIFFLTCINQEYYITQSGVWRTKWSQGGKFKKETLHNRVRWRLAGEAAKTLINVFWRWTCKEFYIFSACQMNRRY